MITEHPRDTIGGHEMTPAPLERPGVWPSTQEVPDMADVTPSPAPRRQIPKRTRFEVLRRDAHTCRYCGASAPDVPLTVDHVIPVALGGPDDPSNLVTACRDCNAGKASTSPDEHTVADVAEDAERWAKAMERAAEIRRSQSRVSQQSRLVAQFYDAWVKALAYEWDLEAGDWEPTIIRFDEAGLTLDDMAEMIVVVARNLATLRKPFRYFCSLCWGEIEARRAVAEELMRGES